MSFISSRYVIGSRIRDLIEGHDGRIILWTDDDTLISLGPKDGTTGEALFAEKCSGCHQSAPISGNRIGPNLAGVVGRRIAALDGYRDYSPSLRGLARHLGRKTTGFIPQGAPRDRSGNCNGLRWRCKRRGTRGHYSVSQHAPLLGVMVQFNCSLAWVISRSVGG